MVVNVDSGIGCYVNRMSARRGQHCNVCGRQQVVVVGLVDSLGSVSNSPQISDVLSPMTYLANVNNEISRRAEILA